MLASLVIRWSVGEAAVRRSLLSPLAALLLGIVYALLRDTSEVVPPIHCGALTLAVRPLGRVRRPRPL
ncbi:hypothetical protein [Microbispora sp. H10830]|uniref:hypothetical protein n=1 Tax=Microbispora sp. H10830 TaxID=2729109 RepID=UPI0016006579|nr:hypothetical protein [Microbispora sp. H10830]